MINKDYLLNLIPRDYLEDVTLLINNSPRYEFLNEETDKQNIYFKRKYTINDLLKIYQNFISGINPEKSAKKIKTPDGFELTSRYIEKLNEYIKFNTEFKFKNTKCDIRND